MTTHADNEMGWATRERVLANLDRMVAANRLTADEAQRLRAATEATEFDQVVLSIRARHAGVKLDAAVADGGLTRPEADAVLDRLRAGEHGRFLRGHLRTLRSHSRARRDGPSSDDQGTPT